MIGAMRGSGPGNTPAIMKAGQQAVRSLVQAHQRGVKMVQGADGAPRIRPPGGGALAARALAPHPQAVGGRLDRHG